MFHGNPTSLIPKKGAHPTLLTWLAHILGEERQGQGQPSSAQLTPADADEHPLAQTVGGVREYDGCVQVAAFPEHPEEVGYVEVVVGGCHQPAPGLPQPEMP